jgi:uncharacterized protein (TIGR03492 family)
MNILLVSNGHAEDLATAGIGAKIQNAKIKALPLVGLGKAYDKAGIENIGLKKVMPSGGFAKEGLPYFLKDLGAGFIPDLYQQIKIIKKEGKDADLLVCVGDIFLVALCGFFTGKPIIFIDGPNSVRIRKYYPIEKWILKQYCKKVIVQDRETAEFLKENNIPGEYLGTWVMDYVSVTREDFGIDKNKTIIGILPGTREEAYANLFLILEVIETLQKNNKELIGLVAFALDKTKLKEKFKSSLWEYQESDATEQEKGIIAKLVFPSGTTILIAEGKFGDVCKVSKLIIGMAGIANEQAVGFGTPVVAFPGHGPQTTLRRWHEIHNITGDSMAILNGTTKEIAEQISEILNNPKRLERMRQIGIESKKDRGGIENIANFIAAYLKGQNG